MWLCMCVCVCVCVYIYVYIYEPYMYFKNRRIFKQRFIQHSQTDNTIEIETRSSVARYKGQGDYKQHFVVMDHFQILIVVLVIEIFCCCLVAKSCLTLCDTMDSNPTRLLCPWDSPGRNTGVGCRFLLQGIFPTQGSNPCLLSLLHCRLILYHWATWGNKFLHVTKIHRTKHTHTKKKMKNNPRKMIMYYNM